MTALLDYVNPQQGSDSEFHYSTGNTLPLAGPPYAMTHWSIENRDDVRFFTPRSRCFHGIRATHQPSPWIGDYGTFLILPQTGPELLDPEARIGVYDPRRLRFTPAGFSLHLNRYRVDVDLAATARCAWLRFTFPAEVPKRIIFDLKCGRSELKQDGSHTFHGHTSNHNGGVPENFRFHFVAHCSAAVAKFHCGVLELPPETTVAELRIGTSFLSPGQAEQNLRELAATLEETAARTTASWEEKLAAIQVDADERTCRTLYTCLHRTMLFPREFHEFDGSGNPVHYSPYSGTARPGVLYADNGFWDTHRTVYPLLSLLDPARYGEILSGWLNAAREGGWFPRWSSPGYRSCMTGTHIDAVYADAAVKGIGGFDLAEAWRYLLKNAYEPVEPHGLFGRRNLAEYIRYGFVPDDQCEHAASRTMDYAANDFCLAQIAGILGDAVHCDDLLRRSRNYRNLWNPAAGILQGRRADGTFSALSPTDWNRTYIEGSSWQCGFAVPHDPEGLIGLFGGPAATVARLDRMQEAPPDFQTGAYGKEIHEMAEMALAGFGQYAHSNQPVHHVLWLYTLAGARGKAAAAIRRVTEELYTPDTLPGDEDNGEMSGWYVFAQMGFYPFCPGRPEYVLAAPQHPMQIRLGNGRMLELAPGSAGTARTISHSELLAGGKIQELHP